MYSENNNYQSDLVNSYAWDTAIVFIQNYSNNSNYANKTSVNNSDTGKLNTGKAGDVVCNIHDMASNCREWSTEHSTNTPSSVAYPCVSRGGIYGSSDYTATRTDYSTTHSLSYLGFRPIYYVKWHWQVESNCITLDVG